MQVAIRADASPVLGGGHLMRCLALAQALAERGARSWFIAAALPDALAATLRAAGHRLVMIGSPPETPLAGAWPAGDQAADAAASLEALGETRPDWVIVDHYGLGSAWEQAARAGGATVLVIDDLADRPHDCDLLLDMTLGRAAADYAPLTPPKCTILAGPGYAPLRPAFAAARPASLARRAAHQSPARRLLISLGQMDHGGHTAITVRAAAACAELERIDVVFGASTAPSLGQVRGHAARDRRIVIHGALDASAMAHLMTAADLAIGAAGSTAWERCCLGLPTIALVLADNQRMIAHSLRTAGVAQLAEPDEHGLALQIANLAHDAPGLRRMGEAAAAVTDGQGAARVIQEMAQVMAGGAEERA